MPDLTHDEQAAQAAAKVASGKVSLRHPHTGDVQVVDADPAAMIPLLSRGYQQVKE